MSDTIPLLLTSEDGSPLYVDGCRVHSARRLEEKELTELAMEPQHHQKALHAIRFLQVQESPTEIYEEIRHWLQIQEPKDLEL